MKLNKVTSSKAVEALGQGASLAGGILASNAGVEAVDSFVKNKMASRGIVAVIGLAAAVVIPNKYVVAGGLGVAGKQFAEMAKDKATPYVTKAGILADALEVKTFAPAPAGTGVALNMALAAAKRRKRGMGNPDLFRLGQPETVNGFTMG